MFQISKETVDSIAEKAPEVKDGLEQLKNISLNDFIVGLSERLINFAFNIAIAIAVFYIGKFIIKRIYRIIASILIRHNIDHSLTTFILSFVNIVLYFILIIIVVGILGIETSSFLALFTSAGVAIGLALSGTLQNFAGGVLILLLKPYKIGDYIEAQGYSGTVREIQIFHTIITTYDNKAIIIPNGGLSTSSINNWSREEYRRVSWDISISYGDDVEVARRAILEMFANDERIVKESIIDSEESSDLQTIANNTIVKEPRKPGFFKRMFTRKEKVKVALDRWQEVHDHNIKVLKPHVTTNPSVVLNALADSSIQIQVRAWVKCSDYWAVLYDYNERIYNELPSHGISFPFPQMDVHIRNDA